MSFLIELDNKLDYLENENYHPDVIILGKDKWEELKSCLQVQIRYLVDINYINDPRQPTYNGIPVIIDHHRPEIVEFYEKTL